MVIWGCGWSKVSVYTKEVALKGMMMASSSQATLVALLLLGLWAQTSFAAGEYSRTTSYRNDIVVRW